MTSRIAETRARHTLDVVEAAYSLDGTDSEWLSRVLHAAPAPVREHLVAFGGPPGAVAPALSALRASPRVRGIWKRVGLHLASGIRLRRARHVLTDAVNEMEQTRGSSHRRDPDGAFELWRGLVAGQWSLVDSWESDGQRYVAAYRDQPHAPDPRRLTRLERVVLGHVTLCCSNKEIAFALGLSEGTIAKAVSHVLRKLRCRRRSDLIAFTRLERSTHVRVGDGRGELGLLSVPHGPSSTSEVRLTEAECAVARRVVAGETNQEIARERGTSAHTVANQINAMFGKLGVHSRPELVRALISS